MTPSLPVHTRAILSASSLASVPEHVSETQASSSAKVAVSASP